MCRQVVECGYVGCCVCVCVSVCVCVCERARVCVWGTEDLFGC